MIHQKPLFEIEHRMERNYGGWESRKRPIIRQLSNHLPTAELDLGGMGIANGVLFGTRMQELI